MINLCLWHHYWCLLLWIKTEWLLWTIRNDMLQRQFFKHFPPFFGFTGYLNCTHQASVVSPTEPNWQKLFWPAHTKSISHVSQPVCLFSIGTKPHLVWQYVIPQVITLQTNTSNKHIKHPPLIITKSTITSYNNQQPPLLSPAMWWYNVHLQCIIMYQVHCVNVYNYGTNLSVLSAMMETEDFTLNNTILYTCR